MEMDRTDSTHAMQSLMTEYADSDPDDLDTSEERRVSDGGGAIESQTMSSTMTTTKQESPEPTSSASSPQTTPDTGPRSDMLPPSPRSVSSATSKPTSPDSKTTSPALKRPSPMPEVASPLAKAKPSPREVEEEARGKVPFMIGSERLVRGEYDDAPSPATLALAGAGVTGLTGKAEESQSREGSVARSSPPPPQPAVTSTAVEAAVDHDEIWDGRESNDSDDEGQVEEQAAVKVETEEMEIVADESAASKTSKGGFKLVSYGSVPGDDEESEDEDEVKQEQDEGDDVGVKQEKVGVVKMEDDDSRTPVSGSTMRSRFGSSNTSLLSERVRHLSREEIRLPPLPPGRCNKKLQEKIEEMLKKQKEKGVDFNQLIERKNDYRNPSLYEKLIILCGIDEIGSNYPPDIYDPHCWKENEFYDALSRQQKIDTDRREREKKERTKVEFVSGTKKAATSLPLSQSLPTLADPALGEMKGRKSKWDQTQPAPAAQATTAAARVSKPTSSKTSSK